MWTLLVCVIDCMCVCVGGFSPPHPLQACLSGSADAACPFGRVCVGLELLIWDFNEELCPYPRGVQQGKMSPRPKGTFSQARGGRAGLGWAGQAAKAADPPPTLPAVCSWEPPAVASAWLSHSSCVPAAH